MTPIELAAVATAAVPGLSPVACAPEPDDAADFDSAVLLDGDRKRWRVRSPRHPEASARLETELLVLRAFPPGVRAELPFLLPTVAGTVRRGDLTTFVYSHLSGVAQSVEELAAGGAVLAKEIGAAMAAIHDLPPGLVDGADLPSYTANEFRQRRLNELDQAATTGKIPPALLRRWEHALEDVALWRFSPCVVHGDLHEDNVLIEGRRVMAVTGWTDLKVCDPADDFAWLVAINNQPFVDAVQESYAAARKDITDRHLLRRAALSAEFALAQWLVKGVAANDQRMVAEAEDMLRTLENDIATFGGQPISTEPEIHATASAAKAGTAAGVAGTASGVAGTGSRAVGPAAPVAEITVEVSSSAEASNKVTVGTINDAGTSGPRATTTGSAATDVTVPAEITVPAEGTAATEGTAEVTAAAGGGANQGFSGPKVAAARETAGPGTAAQETAAAAAAAAGVPHAVDPAAAAAADDTRTATMKVIPLHSR
ncbi:macrolide 2'-phosphotransferase [Arthrobacter sp. H14-L1]|uniref:macrolide 2'-phosphotransferase n=1 Tax=Arthrobacter sp. H14-L1 TaxID=2996697 RepID=UPI00226F2238|nr:macrolide 2'-phosphotransferase [Arthrobacter sp. H14-L1]MCY0903499.1 macrolide 2'-phosphotransferase [Arthrobacter sp. H14-L1]